MHRVFVGLILLCGLSQTAFGQDELQKYPPAKAALEHYKAANQEARRELIKELEAAIKKAKSRQKLEEAQSIEVLKDKIEAEAEANDLSLEKNAELRESLNGSEWGFSSPNVKFRFTKYEIVFATSRKPYRTLGPRAVQYGEERMYFDQELKRVFEITSTFSSRMGAREK